MTPPSLSADLRRIADRVAAEADFGDGWHTDKDAGVVRAAADALDGHAATVSALTAELDEVRSHHTYDHIQRIMRERDEARAARGRCEKHRDTPGPSLYHDCCESERLRALVQEQAAQLTSQAARCAELESQLGYPREARDGE